MKNAVTSIPAANPAEPLRTPPSGSEAPHPGSPEAFDAALNALKARHGRAGGHGLTERLSSDAPASDVLPAPRPSDGRSPGHDLATQFPTRLDLRSKDVAPAAGTTAADWRKSLSDAIDRGDSQQVAALIESPPPGCRRG